MSAATEIPTGSATRILATALAEILRAFEQHLEDEARKAGVPRSQLCPCEESEIRRARVALRLAGVPS